jgi:hypothetical protein
MIYAYVYDVSIQKYITITNQPSLVGRRIGEKELIKRLFYWIKTGDKVYAEGTKE